MIWHIMDTYELVKDVKGPFTSSVVYDRMSARGLDPKLYRNKCYKHLRLLTKQGFLTRTGATKTSFGQAVYLYEVV